MLPSLSAGSWTRLTDHFPPEIWADISFDQAQTFCAHSPLHFPASALCKRPSMCWWPLSQTCTVVLWHNVSNASQISLQNPLSSSNLLSRVSKTAFPTKCCHMCVVWGSVSSCLPVTAQARIALAFRHLFFNCMPCSYLICYPLRHFQWDCLLSSSFLPNIFVLDYIYLLVENFNFPWDSI